jgi:hypothetical protein
MKRWLLFLLCVASCQAQKKHARSDAGDPTLMPTPMEGTAARDANTSAGVDAPRAGAGGGGGGAGGSPVVMGAGGRDAGRADEPAGVDAASRDAGSAPALDARRDVASDVAGDTAPAAAVVQVRPGLLWTDDQGNPIHAHAGNLIKVGARWYWYGESTRDLGAGLVFAAFNGIRCYSSTDLRTWHYEGMVVTPRPSGALSKHLVAYRPKVLYNATTSRYVMILTECCGDGSNGALDTPHLVYTLASSPTGPFVFQKTENPGVVSVYDMGVFKDDDGSAYVLYSDGNAGVSIDRLAADYLSAAQKVVHFTSGACEEAPSMIKAGGRYFLTNSWCSGWSPNQNHYRSAPSVSGPWNKQPDGNLGNGNTYNSQGGYILPITGTAGTTYVYVGDRWDCPQAACDLSMSKYVWLPLAINGSTMTLTWYDSWFVNPATGAWSTTAAGL